MEQIILAGHLLIALAIIGLIMLQQGKGADIGASFGGGGSQTLFGSEGSGSVLTKATAWLAVLFFATSFGLALLANQKAVVEDDLGLVIPAAASAAAAQAEEELPKLDDTPEAITAPAGDDLPQLD